MPAGGSRPCIAGCGCGRHVKPKGAQSPNWVGDRITYKAVHERVRQVRGPAKTHRCLFCAERGIIRPALDWARLPETSGYDIADFIPLCRKCHFWLDREARWTPAHRAAVVARHRKLTEDILAVCRVRYVAGETQMALAREFGVSRSAMLSNGIGRSLRSDGVDGGGNPPRSGPPAMPSDQGARVQRAERRVRPHRRELDMPGAEK
jgi:hypothetical protein